MQSIYQWVVSNNPHNLIWLAIIFALWLCSIGLNSKRVFTSIILLDFSLFNLILFGLYPIALKYDLYIWVFLVYGIKNLLTVYLLYKFHTKYLSFVAATAAFIGFAVESSIVIEYHLYTTGLLDWTGAYYIWSIRFPPLITISIVQLLAVVIGVFSGPVLRLWWRSNISDRLNSYKHFSVIEYSQERQTDP